MPIPIRNNAPWTRSDIKCMKILAKRKQSSVYVGRVLGRTTAAVKWRAMQEGVRFHAIEQPTGIQSRIQKRRFRGRSK